MEMKCVEKTLLISRMLGTKKLSIRLHIDFQLGQFSILSLRGDGSFLFKKANVNLISMYELLADMIKEAVSTARDQIAEYQQKEVEARAEQDKQRTDSVVREKSVVRYMCDVCDYEYIQSAGDPDQGIPAGTKFEDLPDTWCCPICGSPKDTFSKIE